MSEIRLELESLSFNKLPDWCDNVVVGKKADANDSIFARTATAMEMPRCPLNVIDVRPAPAKTTNIFRDALASSMMLNFASRPFSLRHTIILAAESLFSSEV